MDSCAVCFCVVDDDGGGGEAELERLSLSGAVGVLLDLVLAVPLTTSAKRLSPQATVVGTAVTAFTTDISAASAADTLDAVATALLKLTLA